MELSFRSRAVRPLTLSALAVFALATAASAATTPENKCEAAKLRETGKLASCVLSSLSKSAQADAVPDEDAIDSCNAKFSTKLSSAEGKADGACPTTGDASDLSDAVQALADSVQDSVSGLRFIDNGDGTVTDTEQGLMWQKSTAGTGSPSSIDEVRPMCGIIPHLGAISGGEGLGGCNNWSLPTLAQLQSILDCSSPPCEFVSPALGANPTPATVGTTLLLTGELAADPMTSAPCMKAIAIEDGSVPCIDPTATEGRSKVRTTNNCR